MSKTIVDIRWGAHRQAGIALFRALLVKCSRVPLGKDQRHALGNIVRNRFKLNRHLASRQLLVKAFNSGYESLNILSGVTDGDRVCQRKVDFVLAHINRYFTAEPPPTPRALKLARIAAYQADLAKQSPKPIIPAVLRRPHYKITGIRKVPKFVNANGFPFLRFQKPQPKSLSRAIANHIKWRLRTMELRERLAEEIKIAREEDVWDDLLAKQFQDVTVPAEERNSGAWEDELRRAIATAYNELGADARKRAARAATLHRIVAEEKRLATEEKAARKQEKCRLRREAKRVIHGGESP